MQAVWNKITLRGILQGTRAIELLRKEWQTTQLIHCESNHLNICWGSLRLPVTDTHLAVNVTDYHRYNSCTYAEDVFIQRVCETVFFFFWMNNLLSY